MKEKMIFLAWAPPSHSGRSRLLANKLGIDLLEVHFLRQKSRWTAPIKYMLQAVQTLFELVCRGPRVVFVQDPPILASFVVFVYCLFSRSHFIIDSHTDALLASWWQWLMPLHRFLSLRAVCTIVTNAYLRGIIESWGAPAFVLADVPAELHYREFPLDARFTIAMASSFSYDEPRKCVFEAARRLPDVQFYITGNLKLADRAELGEAPGNVHFTGLLPFEEYYGLLHGSDAVLALTTEDHTLQWGACEAVSLGRPVITSDWPFLKSYFNKGTVHVENTPEGIYRGVVQMQRDRERYGRDVLDLRREREREWEQKQNELKAIIRQAVNKSACRGGVQ